MFLLILFISSVYSLPTKLRDVNCLHLSNDTERQINEITTKLSSYIQDISRFYDDLDIRMLKIVIDRHSSDEKEKKTVLKIDINDCGSVNKYREYLLNKNNEMRLMKPDENDENYENYEEVIYFIDYDDLKN